MSTDLSTVQSWMQQLLVRSGADERTALYIEPSAQLTPEQRLAIYQRGYYTRLIQCLEGQFKALKQALGEDLFRDFAHEYLLHHPSASPTLALLGEKFPDFLEASRPDRDEPVREEWIDFMISLGCYEWDLYTVFDAPGNEGKPFAATGTPDNNLRLQPCFFLHKYAFPVNRFYSAVANGEDPEIPDRETVFVAIVRTDFVTRVFPLLEPQFHFLRLLQEGMTVADALLQTAARFKTAHEQAAAAWSEWRKHWLTAGFFAF
jgi:hypothetical protein